jgi:hypothetical protein
MLQLLPLPLLPVVDEADVDKAERIEIDVADVKFLKVSFHI